VVWTELEKGWPLCATIVSADTVNTFKNRLDKFWSNQDVLYMITQQTSMASETVVLYSIYFIH